MSKQYVYAEGDQVHVIPEGSIIWNNQSEDQNVSEYFDANDTIINECTINENYVSSIGSECSDNATQYLSILSESDTAELTLEDLSNLTIDGEDVSSILLLNNNTPTNTIEDIADKANKNDNTEVVVFTMEGSEDLYGIQLMHDESGQVQKYQFKFRQTTEGQLEPIPETVTLLPNDEGDEAFPGKQETIKNQSEQYFFVTSSEAREEHAAQCEKAQEKIIVKEEVVLSDQQNREDICSASVGDTREYKLSNIKREHYLEAIQECDEIQETSSINVDCPELVINVSQFEENVGVNEDVGTENFDSNEGQFLQHFMAPSSHVEVEYETEVEVTKGSCNSENSNENEVQLTKENCMSKNNNTAKIMGYKTSQESFLYEQHKELSVKPPSENQISHKEPKNKRPSISIPKYYVVCQEKENLMAVPHSSVVKTQQAVSKISKCMKPNSRSVLRSSVAKNQEKQVAGTVKKVGSECDIYLKRFSKNKDALLAKRFHSFLNRTTIPQAPVRQTRQPRKQEIKPIVERSREEIIVQEVLVSSSGFVESHGKNCDVGPLRVTAIVELSDSEDESSSRLNTARKSTNKKRKFDKTIIEIHSDEEPASSLTQAKVTSQIDSKSLDHPPVKAKQKKVQGKAEATSELTLKKEVICPHCPKTFPSQNSLNTHIIHHNLENSLKNKNRMSLNSRQSMFTKPEYKHKCGKCQATFKNKILLEKHQCTIKQKFYSCPVCLQQFRDMTLFNIHKKSHAKSNLIKNTTLTTVSSRRSSLQQSSSTSKLPQQNTVGLSTFKCSECPKVCDSESKLLSHIKIHKKFVCSFCSGAFASKVMLDTHIRTNCVKNKRASYTIKKSSVQNSPKRMSLNKTADLNHSVLGVKMNCDKCSMKFGTFRNLYTHKVQKHGMSTPDKTLLTKPKRYVSNARSAHGGVPANPRLQQAFATLRKKLAEADNLVIQ